MSGVVAPFAWYGGKSRLAPAIVSLLPHHDSYIEPFGGAAAVLVLKPRATLEVLWRRVEHGAQEQLWHHHVDPRATEEVA